MAHRADSRSTPTLAANGRDFSISWGSQSATVTEVGGSLREYTVDGVPILEGHSRHALPVGHRGKIMAPWPNRVRDGVFEFEGTRHELPITDHQGRNARHGLVMYLPWSVFDHDSSSVTMSCILHPQPGYPFILELRATYSLGPDGLSSEVWACNRGSATCPYGVGVHPYFSLGASSIDELLLEVPANRFLPADERLIPVGPSLPVGEGSDFRRATTLRGADLDTAFTAFDRDADGLAWIGLSYPATGRRAGIWMDEAFDYVVVFTADHLPGEFRRSGVAIEPMTCPQNALATGEDIVLLAPGDVHRARWGIRPGTAS